MEFAVAAEHAGLRLDRYLAEQMPDASRSQIQTWIRQGRVLVDDVVARPALKLQGGEMLEVDPAPRRPLRAFAEPISLDILYEDDAIVAVNKPADMTVHAGAGEASHSGTLVNALLHRFGRLSEVGGELRPGIVHRLDRLTSGIILVAKTDRAHRRLAEQFEARQVKKSYQALVHGRVEEGILPPGRKGRHLVVDGLNWVRIEAPIGRDRRNRYRMAVVASGRAAISDYRPLAATPRFSRLEVRIHTGRTHQIRVHLAWVGRPVVGDALYGAPAEIDGRAPLERFYLHAARLGLEHPISGEPLDLKAPPPAEFEALAQALAL